MLEREAYGSFQGGRVSVLWVVAREATHAPVDSTIPIHIQAALSGISDYNNQYKDNTKFGEMVVGGGW